MTAIPENILKMMVDGHMASQAAQRRSKAKEVGIEASMEAATRTLEKLSTDMTAMQENLRIVQEHMQELSRIALERERKQEAFRQQAEARQRKINSMRRRDRRRDLDDYVEWKARCQSAFEDKAAMSSLPLPALPRCSRIFCEAYSMATPCRHNVEQFLRGCGQYSSRLLKIEVSLWHPDRFSACDVGMIKDFQEQAIPFYRVLHDLYVQARGQAEG